jgi:phosphoserine phosphatase
MTQVESVLCAQVERLSKLAVEQEQKIAEQAKEIAELYQQTHALRAWCRKLDDRTGGLIKCR